MSIYELKPRFQRLLLPCLGSLRNWGLSPNDLTLAGIILSIFGGFFLLTMPAHTWIIAPILLFRMGLNALDGMMAKTYQLQSKKGAILNEMGDIISDLVLYAPLLLVLDVSSALLTGFCVALICTEFSGVLAQAVYGKRAYQGPMGKSDRAFWMSLAGIAVSVFPLLSIHLEIFGWILVAAMGITIVKRLQAPNS